MDLNRVIKERDVNMIYIIGPGHRGPGIVVNTWLEDTYSALKRPLSALKSTLPSLV